MQVWLSMCRCCRWQKCRRQSLYLQLMEKLKGTKTKVAFDPAQETYRLWQKDLLVDAVSRTDFIFCNEYEAKVMAMSKLLKENGYEHFFLEDLSDGR